MSTITTKDGRQIYYKDWGKDPVVKFSHGWPLNADAWDGQMLFLAQRGFRVVAHDRRGHGRSTQTSVGNDMNGYADDLAAVIEALDLKGITLVGHSTGGGEVARYIGRYGTKRAAKGVRSNFTNSEAKAIDQMLKDYRVLINPLKTKARNYYLAHLNKQAQAPWDPQGGFQQCISTIVNVVDSMSRDRQAYMLRVASDIPELNLREALGCKERS